jgi:hypothetical protein
MISRLLVIAASAFLLTNCGDDQPTKKNNSVTPPAGEENTGNTGSGNQEGTTTAPTGEETKKEENKVEAPKALTCDEQWANYVKLNVAGNYAKYKTDTVSKFGANETKNSSEMKMTVISSDDTSVKMETESKVGAQVFKSNSEFTKTQFMTGCEKPAEAVSTEKGEEAGVDVPAGKFDTVWFITKTEQNGMKSNTKSWSTKLANGDMLLIKSETQSQSAQMTMSSKMVLVETNRK